MGDRKITLAKTIHKNFCTDLVFADLDLLSHCFLPKSHHPEDFEQSHILELAVTKTADKGRIRRSRLAMMTVVKAQ